MKKMLLGLSLSLLIVAALVSSCSASQEVSYRGTATVNVDFYSYDLGGAREYSGSQSYTKDVEVILGPPTRCEGFEESYVFSWLASMLTFGDYPFLSVPMLPVSS